jgi:hypothetical protein
MTRRRWIQVAAVVLAVLVTTPILLVLYTARPGVVNVVNFNRIKPGDTAERVEQLFGGPGEQLAAADAVTGLNQVEYVVLRPPLGWPRHRDMVLPVADWDKRDATASSWVIWRTQKDCFFVTFVGGAVDTKLDLNPKPSGFAQSVFRLLSW